MIAYILGAILCGIALLPICVSAVTDVVNIFKKDKP